MRGAAAAGAAMADTAVMHDAIEAHPPGAHGVSHDLPAMPHGPAGVADESSMSAGAIEPGARRVPASAACSACGVAMAVMDSAGGTEWLPCIRHSVPLATSESWSSSALESNAVRR